MVLKAWGRGLECLRYPKFTLAMVEIYADFLFVDTQWVCDET
jgi:hypothetical protein